MDRKEAVAHRMFDEMVVNGEFESNKHHEAAYQFIRNKLFYGRLQTAASKISESIEEKYITVYLWLCKFKEKLLNELFVN